MLLAKTVMSDVYITSLIADLRLHRGEVVEHAIHSVRHEAVCACKDGVHIA